jgi:cytochrome b561
MADNLRNNRERYGKVAQWLHWIMAFLILATYLAIYYRAWFTEPRTPPSTMALQIHMSLGFYLFTLVVLRLIWKMMNNSPDPVAGPAWQQASARWTHRLFYVFLLLMPITGYIFAGLGNEFFYNTPIAFELIPKFSDTQAFQAIVVNGFGISDEAWRDAREPFKDFHVIVGGIVLIALFVLHIGAALYHQYVLRDGTLHRMTRQD